MNTKSDLLDYLAEAQRAKSPIPSIAELSKVLGISVASVREQLEVARSLGFVDVKPKVGIQSRVFSMNQLLELGVTFGAKVQPDLPEALRDLRKHLEISYWYEAAPLLTSQDVQSLRDIVAGAFNLISGEPMRIPEQEHRDFHLTIFSHLDNPIVKSIMETFWKSNEEMERAQLPEQAYLEQVWSYHQQITEALEARDFERGFQWLVEHMDLVKQRKKTERSQRFE